MTGRKKSWLFLEWFGTAVLGALPDTPAVNAAIAQLFYFAFNKRLPNLRTPRTFTDRLINLKLSDEARDPRRVAVTDKEFVKEFVTQTIGAGHVVPTAAILRTAAEIDGFSFPLPCVVKATHSSQEVIAFSEAQPSADQRRTLKYWLRKSYFDANREPNYKTLEHKLIVEPVIGGAFGEIEDIKVLCFHGRPKLVWIDHDRYAAHTRDFFTLDGEYVPVSYRYPSAGRPFPYPDQLAKLKEFSEKLSAGFSFMRVDFYFVDGVLLVGELTSFISNCVATFQPPSAELAFGRLFDEPDANIFSLLSETSQGGPGASAGMNRTDRGASAGASDVLARGLS